MQNTVIIYLICINLITFIIRGIDKRKATKQARRISERQLLLLIGCGGIFGALLGQQLFRHKTIKGVFLRKMWVIMAIWIFIVTYTLFLY